jgi:lipopolysaccharide biosynthesis glycosyltransferase
MTVPTFLPSDLKKIEGVIVGCDQHQEWLIPWWWSKYSEYNDHPVAFIDFGMSEKARNFCQSRGELIFVHDSMQFLAGKSEVSSPLAALWESLYKTEVWNYRKGWFKKPLALFLSPYERSLWLDLDCEVISSLAALFKGCDHEEKIALAREPEHLQALLRHQGLLEEKEVLYNSGVIAFRHDAPLIREWMEKTFTDHAKFVGDQNLLSRLIYEKEAKITELPPIYNWRIFVGQDPSHVIVHPQTVIIHWAHDWGKEQIRKYGGLSQEFRNLLLTLT